MAARFAATVYRDLKGPISITNTGYIVGSDRNRGGLTHYATGGFNPNPLHTAAGHWAYWGKEGHVTRFEKSPFAERESAVQKLCWDDTVPVTSANGSATAHPTRWIEDLENLGGTMRFVNGITDDRTIIGGWAPAVSRPYSNRTSFAAVWDQNQILDVAWMISRLHEHTNFHSTEILAIQPYNVVLGIAAPLGQDKMTPFLFDGAKFFTLERCFTPDTRERYLGRIAMNRHLDVVGSFRGPKGGVVPVAWTNSAIVLLARTKFAPYGQARTVNERGAIAGVLWCDSELGYIPNEADFRRLRQRHRRELSIGIDRNFLRPRATRWRLGGTKPDLLDEPKGAIESEATTISELGVIGGHVAFRDPSASPRTDAVRYHATLWTNSGDRIDLNETSYLPSDIHLRTVVGVNANGEVLCSADPDETTVVLTPVH